MKRYLPQLRPILFTLGLGLVALAVVALTI